MTCLRLSRSCAPLVRLFPMHSSPSLGCSSFVSSWTIAFPSSSCTLIFRPHPAPNSVAVRMASVHELRSCLPRERGDRQSRSRKGKSDARKPSCATLALALNEGPICLFILVLETKIHSFWVEDICRPSRQDIDGCEGRERDRLALEDMLRGRLGR